ncbi:hypothetical protein ABIF21_000018 [Bradyrhizobium elkanii]|uniref:hypothetical protein n=1 Tax=Bradyrhizobium elkanii TaxID=29448 RepID=UPI001021B1B9|nr:hypothetical protein [Bradyrhizobium elkanii]NWL40353.1 hypothetical protein [Bradyrhizobium elkanii]RYM21097.1 hypothetical protein EWH13_28195 [Bradyrhizobium elkanii]
MTDLVAVLGARLDQFAADLNQAGDMADAAVSRIENAFSSLNPGLGSFATIGTSIAGATAAATALLAVLETVNAQVAQIGKNAEYVGVTVERFQQIRYGATQGGVSGKDADADLKKVADLLVDAQNNENSLTKILDANNIKYRDRNGAVTDLNGLLKIAGDLLGRFDSIPEKTKAAQMLGLSSEWVEALRGGSKAFEDVASSANAAGAVIDAQTIAKAQIFDREWKKSTDQLSYQFKAVTADIAGWLDDLINKAQNLVAEILKSQNIQPGSGQGKFDAYADALSIAAKDAAGLPQDLEQVDRVLDRLRAKPNADEGIIAGLEEIRAKAKEAADESERAAKIWSALNFPGGVPTPAARPAAADEKTGTGVLPVRKQESDSRDQFDTSIDQINKHIATLNADTAATFQNNAARQQLRAEFQALTAIMRDDGEVTQQQIEAYEKLRGSMSAQQALEAAGINLTSEHKTAFLAASEGIKQAAASYDQARQKLADINKASAEVGSALSSAFADAVVEGKNLNDVLSSLVKTLEKAAINSVFSSFFNAPIGGGLSPAAALFKSFIPGFAEGTDSAPGGMAWVGERGPELVNLPRGAQVIPNSALRSGGGGSVAISVNNNVSPTMTVTAQQSVDGRGNRRIDLVLDDQMAANLGRSGSATQRALSGGFGAKPRGVRR